MLLAHLRLGPHGFGPGPASPSLSRHPLWHRPWLHKAMVQRWKLAGDAAQSQSSVMCSRCRRLQFAMQAPGSSSEPGKVAGTMARQTSQGSVASPRPTLKRGRCYEELPQPAASTRRSIKPTPLPAPSTTTGTSLLINAWLAWVEAAKAWEAWHGLPARQIEEGMDATGLHQAAQNG